MPQVGSREGDTTGPETRRTERRRNDRRPTDAPCLLFLVVGRGLLVIVDIEHFAELSFLLTRLGRVHTQIALLVEVDALNLVRALGMLGRGSISAALAAHGAPRSGAPEDRRAGWPVPEF